MFTVLWLKDTLERTFRTFAQTWLGVMVASGVFDFSVSAVKAAAAAGLASAAAVVMAALSTLDGNPGAGVTVAAVETGEVPPADDSGQVTGSVLLWVVLGGLIVLFLLWLTGKVTF